MLDYSNIKTCYDYLKSCGGIVYIDTRGGISMEGDGLDSFYQGVFKKVDGYQLFARPGNALLDYKIVEIPGGVDEILLFENREKIKEFLDQGGIIISFTQNYLEWLPGNSLYQASPTPIKDRSVVSCAHPITEGVKEYDMNYRCGVKGFFNRGFFKAPAGATVILKDSDGECVAYIDSATTKGVILSTAGADLVGFGLAESSTAKRLGVNLMLWLEKTMKEREAA